VKKLAKRVTVKAKALERGKLGEMLEIVVDEAKTNEI
jgi:hypothetical protein